MILQSSKCKKKDAFPSDSASPFSSFVPPPAPEPSARTSQTRRCRSSRSLPPHRRSPGPPTASTRLHLSRPLDAALGLHLDRGRLGTGARQPGGASTAATIVEVRRKPTTQVQSSELVLRSALQLRTLAVSGRKRKGQLQLVPMPHHVGGSLPRFTGASPPRLVGPASGWRRTSTNGGCIFASHDGSDPKWVAGLGRLLEVVLLPKYTVNNPFLGLDCPHRGLDWAGKATRRSFFRFFLPHRRPAGRTPCFHFATTMPNSARYGTTCITSRRGLPPTTTLWHGSSEPKVKEGREADASPTSSTREQ